MNRFLGLCALALLLAARPVVARPNKIALIDSFCRQTREELREVSPYFYSGPNPWIPLDEAPPQFLDEAVATVYLDALKVRWLVLDMQEMGKQPGQGWYQTVNYYFDSQGWIAKRERHFEQVEANTALDEFFYYQKGKRFKEHLEHHPLGKGSEDWSQLFDPNAPEYLNTSQLPFSAAADAGRRVARYPENPAGACDSGANALPSTNKCGRFILTLMRMHSSKGNWIE